jgi:acetyl esterase/lipase
MSRRTLALAATGAALTANGLRPFPGGSPLAVPSFFCGWLTNELAPHNLAATVAAVGLKLRRRHEWDREDRVALALDLASSAGLALLIRQSMRAGTVVHDALSESLGESVAGRDPEPDKADLATPWRQVLMPWRMKDPRVRRVADIDYVGDGHARHRLDLYLPRDPEPGPRPVVLQIHGGAWVIGRKDQQGLPLMTHLAARGWICAAVSYPLSPKARWPEHLVAVKQALAWLRDNIADYGGDPDWIAVTGGSAGGHLAAMLALTANEPRHQPGFEEADTSVAAAVPFYGVYDLSNELGTRAGQQRLDYFLARMVLRCHDAAEAKDASPLQHVSTDAPPMFVIHGAHDSLVNVAEAREFVRRLRDVSRARVAYAELPGTQHAFDVFPSIRSAHVIRGVERFLTATHAAKS